MDTEHIARIVAGFLILLLGVGFRFLTNGHGKYASPDDETRHARFPDRTTSHFTWLSKNDNQVAGYLPQTGGGNNDSLREFHDKVGVK